MNYLLDVNILVSWGWEDHESHDLVAHWIEKLKTQNGAKLLTTSITELGFVRITMQRSRNQVSCHQAGRILSSMLKSLGNMHQFLPDNQNAEKWPDWCKGSAQTTDAHLIKLVKSHDAVLATLDKRIPNAHLLTGVQD